MSKLIEVANQDPAYAYKRVKIRKARRNFLDFVSYTKPDYHINWHHKLICDDLQDFITNPNRDRLMIFVGPRTGKSEIVSRRLPAYCFGHDPDMAIIAASYGADLAQSMNRDLQRVIDNDRYRELFPETQLSGKNVAKSAMGNSIRTSDKFEIVGREGRYKSAGVGGALTGSGGDLLIIDDPVKDMKEAMSATTQKVTWDWYTSVAATRLSKNGKVIVMLTRWNERDLAGKLLERAKQDPDADQWEVLCFPMEFEEDHAHVHSEDPRKEGDLLWPEWFPEKKMLKTKATVGSRVYSSLYQQRPSPAGGAIFKRAWFNYYKEAPREYHHKMLSIDCSFKNTENADYVSFHVWGFSGTNKYLLWRVKERLDFPETLAEIAAIHSRFQDLRYTLVEDKANGPAVISTLKKKIRGLIAFNPNGDSKEGRAASVAPQVEAGDVWLPDPHYPKNRDSMPWCAKGVEDMVEEIIAFPNAANDDDVDAMVQMLIKEETASGWLAELVKEDENPEENKNGIMNEISDILGIDFTETESASEEYLALMRGVDN